MVEAQFEIMRCQVVAKSQNVAKPQLDDFHHIIRARFAARQLDSHHERLTVLMRQQATLFTFWAKQPLQLAADAVPCSWSLPLPSHHTNGRRFIACQRSITASRAAHCEFMWFSSTPTLRMPCSWGVDGLHDLGKDVHACEYHQVMRLTGTGRELVCA